MVKSMFLRRISPVLRRISLWIVLRHNRDDVVWIMDVRWSGYLSPTMGNQRLIWRFNLFLGINAGLESSKI